MIEYNQSVGPFARSHGAINFCYSGEGASVQGFIMWLWFAHKLSFGARWKIPHMPPTEPGN